MTDAKVPSRTIDPVIVKYLAITKTDFKDLVDKVHTGITEEYGGNYRTAIRIEGFDAPFTDTELLFDEINTNEWVSLKEPTVKFYEDTKSSYLPTVDMRFNSSIESKKVGLKLEILKGTTNQKVSLRETVRLLLPDYERKIFLTDTLTAWILAVASSLGFAVYAVLSISVAKMNSGLWLNLVPICILIGMVTYILVVTVHRKYIIPHLEMLKETGETRLKRLGKILGGLVALTGLIGFIMTLLD